jgi:putative CocE/NonD family hydrolase
MKRKLAPVILTAATMLIGSAATALAASTPAGRVVREHGTGWNAYDWAGYTRPVQYPKVITEKDVPITMPDGTVLSADVIRPDAPGRFPVLLYQNPYGTNGLTNNNGGASNFTVQRGYVNLIVDGRGTGQSGGSWTPFSVQAQHDGYDLVQWAAHQPWSDGKVAGAGCSALAVMQLLTAAERPPALKAIFPCLPMGDAYRDIVMTGGSVNTSFVPLWFGLVAAGMVQIPGGNPVDGALTILSKAAGLSDSAGTYLSAMGGVQMAYDGPYWRSISPLEIADRIRVPTFITGGLHCIFQRGEPLLYEKIKQHAFSRLLIGPWYHLAAFQGLPDDGVPGAYSLELAWYDHWLKGINTHVKQMPKVTQYEWGSDRYTTVQDWPDPKLTPQRLYLRGGSSLSPAAPGSGEKPQSFAQDPGTGICTLSSSQWTAGGGTGSSLPCENQPDPDQALGEAYYETPPLTHAMTINGPILADVWLTTTAHDAPVTVRVFDVAPNGSVNELTDGWLAASFRQVDPSRSRYMRGQLMQPWHPFTAASVLPVDPGVAYQLPVEVFATSAMIEPDHRLRIVIASGDFPHQLPPVDTLANSLVGTTSILTNPEQASYVELPLVGSSCTLGHVHYSSLCRTWSTPKLIGGEG